MKTKTSELFGLALDWAVAKCEGHEIMPFDQLFRENGIANGYPLECIEQHLTRQPQHGQLVIVEVRNLQLDMFNPEITTPSRCAKNIPRYSSDWAQGGLIIEQEIDQISRYETYPNYQAEIYVADDYENCHAIGPTPLIAAMRCYVANKLGDEVEVPEELK